ncbi:hypothetical protein CLOSTMETH_02081 [[Clostridium] methylpentosum DSM 5476]|uniref:Uncharacterized protein n=1 Tax=[Clostridium] methylpentosum DSM 5476 TaxID=537013 RepID=C0EE02_9FIRM|nr:hypothetical protein CLOSTMETH_02081 [[Clostridium] methylpentosum DSM 5476]
MLVYEESLALPGDYYCVQSSCTRPGGECKPGMTRKFQAARS